MPGARRRGALAQPPFGVHPPHRTGPARMIPTLIGIGLVNLRRDRVVQAMTFFLPIVFFSIFAGVFGSQGRDTTSRVRVAVVDEDHSPASERLIAALKKEGGLRVQTAARPPGVGPDERGPQR